MPRAALAFLSVIGLAIATCPPAAAVNPTEPVICTINSLFGPVGPVEVTDCWIDAAADSPLCLQGYHAASGTLRTFPCALPCDATAPGWVLGVELRGLPGDSVTATLSCGGAAALEATATALATGSGVGYGQGPLPNDGSAMACGLTGPVPASVTDYIVSCQPDP